MHISLDSLSTCAFIQLPVSILELAQSIPFIITGVAFSFENQHLRIHEALIVGTGFIAGLLSLFHSHTHSLPPLSLSHPRQPNQLSGLAIKRLHNNRGTGALGF